MWTPLIVGDFQFDEASLEVPERFGDVGGMQRVAQHDFPGGIRTHKALGYFPSELRWHAMCSAPDAPDRIEALKRIVVAGNEIKLSWGLRAWYGRLTHITPTAHNDFRYEFDLQFMPRVDLGSPPTLAPLAGIGPILALHLLSIQNLIKYGFPQGFGFAIVAGVLAGPFGIMSDVLTSALLQAGGAVAAISISNQQQITQSSLAALSAISPYQTSSDPTESSPANDAAAHIQAIQNLVQGGSPPIAEIQTINPNLVVLAAQYYGDGTQWRYIATANGLADPQPIGSYDLVIPQLPS